MPDINSLNNITFTSRSIVPNGTIVVQIWDSDDGITSNSSNSFMPKNFPKVPEDKTYNIKMIVNANSGSRDRASLNVFVPASCNISGNFSAEQFDACTNERILFTAEAENVPTGAVYE
ncbi:MAG: hypothetical protein RI983_1076 [Bacteroidota bacterium]